MQKIININIRTPTIRKQIELNKLQSEHLACCKELFSILQANKGVTQTEFHHLTYKDFRKKYKLSADLLISARTCVWNRRKITNKINSVPIRFNSKLFRIDTNNNFVICLSCLNKSKRVNLSVIQDGAYQRLAKNLINGFTISSILLFKDFRVQVLIKKEFEKPIESKKIIGIDTNGNNIAVSVYNTKKKRFLRHFYFGKKMFIKRKIIERRKSRLQGFADLGSQKAFESLKKLKRYEYNFIRDSCWKLAHKIIDLSKSFGNATIVVEDLKNLRVGRKLGNSKGKRVNKIINKIPYGKLFHFLSCLCEENIITFSKINPYHTSQLCSRCGALNKSGKVYKTYVCKSCGQIIDRDNNASKNICKLFGERSILTNTSQTSLNRVAVNQPLPSNEICAL